jgi:hypothetical protein
MAHSPASACEIDMKLNQMVASTESTGGRPPRRSAMMKWKRLGGRAATTGAASAARQLISFGELSSGRLENNFRVLYLLYLVRRGGRGRRKSVISRARPGEPIRGRRGAARTGGCHPAHRIGFGLVWAGGRARPTRAPGRKIERSPKFMIINNGHLLLPWRAPPAGRPYAARPISGRPALAITTADNITSLAPVLGRWLAPVACGCSGASSAPCWPSSSRRHECSGDWPTGVASGFDSRLGLRFGG